MTVQVSPNFKKMTSKAIFAIVLFIALYLLLLTLAIGITFLCVLGGIALIIAKPMLLTIGLGIGLASLGFFILVFLFKFLFKKHEVYRGHLLEITEHEEPKLFSFIQEIVKEVKTDLPKRIYLSGDVNASVFYDSSFWSMIFPIRKNLQIGLGLVNTITEQEFKAILAHEFGHFSQRSMKVGSFVYHVNQVIFNMLYDNESFDKMIQKWANVSGYFSFFLVIAIRIIEGIQWILRKMFDFVNVSYMGLSREMEFHADEIAANVAGYVALRESLLRMDLADHSFNASLNFYASKIDDNIRSKNIYKEQEFVMCFLATESKLAFKNNLPDVSEFELNKYNKSKLNIKNQWASHPSVEERIRALEKLNIEKTQLSTNPAFALFLNSEKLQERMTEKMFLAVSYGQTAGVLDFVQFKNEYAEIFNNNRFPKEYNSYFDNKNPVSFDINTEDLENEIESFEVLFSNENVDVVYENIALENDLSILKSIANKEFKIKYFDYEGQKYNSKDTNAVIQKLEKELEKTTKYINEIDRKIYTFFFNQACKNGDVNVFKEKYLTFQKQDALYDQKLGLSNDIIAATNFINVVTPFEQIESNFKAVSKLEINLKNELKIVLDNASLKNELSKQTMANFEKYTAQELVYFANDTYDNDNLKVFFEAINDYNYLLGRTYFFTKLDLLKFQMEAL